MPAASITALIAIIIFFAYLGWIFFFPVLELAVNGVIIYVLFLRAHVEIAREEKHYFYLAGAAAALIIYLFAGNFLKGILVWGITTFIILAFALAQIGMLGHQMHKKYIKKLKR